MCFYRFDLKAKSLQNVKVAFFFPFNGALKYSRLLTLVHATQANEKVENIDGVVMQKYRRLRIFYTQETKKKIIL